MYKAVLFDWEGVVAAADKPISFSWLTTRLHDDFGVQIEAARQALFAEVGPFASGLIDNYEFWRRVSKTLGIAVPRRFQETIWSEWPNAEALPEMRELVLHVKKQGLKAIILSNILPTSAAEVRKRGGYDMFDREVLSYIEGARKPEIKLYQQAVKLAGCAPQECIFIEDQERFIVPAEKMGITCILAKSPPQVIHDLKRLIG